MRNAICALFAIALFTGCATKQRTGTWLGAGGGALLGAGVGKLAGGNKGAVIGGVVGAGVGAATGAVIGHYMDKQEAALKNVEGAKVDRQGDKLIVRFDAAILFDTGKAKLRRASRTDLEEFAKVLVEYPDTEITVEGHSDSTGSKKKNKKLSRMRAKSVVEFFEDEGVDPERLTFRGLGESNPVEDNDTAEGRQANRRVELLIHANKKLERQQVAGAEP